VSRHSLRAVDKKGTYMEEQATRVLSFFGPPGTGKGTVAHRCVKELGYKMLSTGDLARSHIQEQTELGKQLSEYVNKGLLIPDDLITQMVFEWLQVQVKPGATIILDGFPRTRGQADLFLQAMKEDPDLSGIKFRVINFELSEDEVVKRISSRLVCSNKECQEVYSTIVKMPKKVGVCDICGSPLIRRLDDEPEVVRERLNVFAKFKDELLDFYKDSEATVINFLIPQGSPDVVFEVFSKLI